MQNLNYNDFYYQSIRNKEAFWAEQAENIHWFKKPEQILTQDDNGFYRWYQGGTLNTCYLAIDKHIADGKADEVAMIYDSAVQNKIEKFTYRQMLEKVSKLAGAMQEMGIEKGDRVIIYMPMIPEAIFSMLACARIGAVHSVVFGGFAAHELAIRIDDAKPKLILTANYGIEIDRYIAYKPIVDQAVETSNNPPEHVVIFNRGDEVPFENKTRDIDFSQFLKQGQPVQCVELNAHDPLYVLYTSGTTGKPKGIVRDNGGHAVALNFSMKYIYNAKPGEAFWAASDVGWVVGHSYITYAPLIYGCTTVLFEGKPIRTPDSGTFWRVISEHKVATMFTAPTAIRAIRKEDPDAQIMKQYDLSCLRTQFLAGERCDAATLNWLSDKLQVPVIDHWWQTESGWPMLANMAGVELMKIKPGSAAKPVCGFDIRILNEAGHEVKPGEEGYVVARLPLPPGCLPTLYNDDERFSRGYLEHFPGYYFTGDGGYMDEEGYFFITGRVDDIINVAGHRLSTAEMEEIVASHADVAECAVIGIHDDLKGQVPLAIIVRKSSALSDAELEKEVVGLVRSNIGAVAALKNVVVAQRLPKTRSGKILRKLMRAICDKKEFTIPSTIDDPAIIGEIELVFQTRKVGAFAPSSMA